MLYPAIAYKEEIEKAFAKEIYTKGYFYYTGYPHCNTVPEIKTDDCLYQYAMVNKDNKVIGYLSYRIDTYLNSVYNFELYSFDKGNPIIGKDLFTEMEKLVKRHHRLEWRMIGGNPVKKHYDKFCEEHGGNIITLHDACRDEEGNYCNDYIYEIINKQV